MRQLDWQKAAELCEEYKGHRVYAGLIEDWMYTSGEIFDGEKRVKNESVFVSSYWATPVIMVDGDDGFGTYVICWTEGDDCEMPDWWFEGDES